MRSPDELRRFVATVLQEIRMHTNVRAFLLLFIFLYLPLPLPPREHVCRCGLCSNLQLAEPPLQATARAPPVSRGVYVSTDGGVDGGSCSGFYSRRAIVCKQVSERGWGEREGAGGGRGKGALKAEMFGFPSQLSRNNNNKKKKRQRGDERGE